MKTLITIFFLLIKSITAAVMLPQCSWLIKDYVINEFQLFVFHYRLILFESLVLVDEVSTVICRRTSSSCTHHR